MKEPPRNLRRVVRRLRKNREMNVYQFAKLLGVAPNTVKNWETGYIRSMNTATQRKVERALKLTALEGHRYFYLGELPPEKPKAPIT